ncbi:MAG: Tn3 family transposase [Burkholderiales bacterium]|nr:Tn3 family transposase [Betaproteobacteria bacterium]MDX2218241.1 Tn3 family transposase [Burkholderiales bacterium]
MRDFHRWQLQYLGTNVFPKTLTAVELDAFFTFTPAELKQIRTRKTDLRIAAAIQLGFLRMTGTPLEIVKVIPSAVLRHVAKQLELPPITIASLRAIYKRRQSLFDHQQWAIDALKFSRPNSKQLPWLLPYLKREAQHATSLDRLVELGKVWLYQHNFISPGDRPIRDYAREAMLHAEQVLLNQIKASVPVDQLINWESAVLAPRGDTGRTNLEWLQQPPRANTNPQLRGQIDRIEFLKALGVQHLNLEMIPMERRKAYAAALRNVRPAKFKELQDPLRTLRLVCYLHVALHHTTDTAALMGDKRIMKTVRDAKDRAKNLITQESLSSRDLLEQIYDLVDDDELSDAEFRDVVRNLKLGSGRPEFPTNAAAIRWALTEPGTPVRALLAELAKLDLHADPNNPSHENLVFLQSVYAEKRNDLPGNTRLNIPRPWRAIIEGPDRERALRALEAATLLGLRKSLRSGAVWIDHSESFRSRDKLLIDRETWAKQKALRHAQLNLPISADVYVNRLLNAYEARLKTLEQVVKEGHITIEDGMIRVPRLKALAPLPDVEKHREAMFQQIGTVQFPDLILEMDSATGFSRAILGRAARSELELLQVYAGMLAHGTALDATGVALMVPQLKPHHILAGMQFFEDRAAVRQANDLVSSYQRRLPITAAWGDGTLASSDMMSLDVSRQIWAARLDPKRGIPSVGTYTHVSDFWSIVYDQPIILNERQAGAAIEGAIRQTEITIDRLAVDTHGYTDFAMGVAKLLGFDLCPRLARLAERHLFAPKTLDIPENLLPVTERNLSVRQIAKYWDDLVRIAASIETGQTTATIALARFGSSAIDNPVYRAGVQLGKLVRSLYLCDYFASEPFRRTINRILVHGEAVHQLQRSIYQGSFSKPRGQREDELFAISGSLTLMTNLCLAWTSSKMQGVLSSPNWNVARDPAKDWVGSVSPAHFRNINFRGTFSFPIQAYRDRVLDDVRRAVNQ